MSMFESSLSVIEEKKRKFMTAYAIRFYKASHMKLDSSAISPSSGRRHLSHARQTFSAANMPLNFTNNLMSISKRNIASRRNDDF